MHDRDALPTGGRLGGKVAVVTGASRGIGFAIAHALLAEGCAVAITARDVSRLNAAADELMEHGAASHGGMRLYSGPCDVSDENSVAHFFARLRRDFPRVDILVNNAGVSHAMSNVADLPTEDWRRVIETNLTGMFLCTRAALPLMPDGGTIINNLSIAARNVFAGESAYCASKFGALGLTNTLREELRPRGIRVISLMAGATDTAIWNQFWPEAPREKMLSPETAAAAVVHALVVPEQAGLEELVLMPTGGTL